MNPPPTHFGSGLVEAVHDVALFTAVLVLVLLSIAVTVLAYKYFSGIGTGFSNGTDLDDRGLQRGDCDDEWEFY